MPFVLLIFFMCLACIVPIGLFFALPDPYKLLPLSKARARCVRISFPILFLLASALFVWVADTIEYRFDHANWLGLYDGLGLLLLGALFVLMLVQLPALED
jgi:hypothetical protein